MPGNRFIGEAIYHALHQQQGIRLFRRERNRGKKIALYDKITAVGFETDGDPSFAKGLYVAVNRAYRNTKPRGQRFSGHVFSSLQQGEHTKKAVDTIHKK